MHLLHHRDGRSPGRLTAADLVQVYRWPDVADGPVVRSNFVATLDGSVQGLDGRSGSINTPSDHRVFALHRALADVILVGAGTVRDEGYRAVDLRPWQRSVRQSEDLTDYPTLVVISGSLRLDPTFVAPEDEHGPVIIVTTSDHDEATREPFVDAGAELLTAPDGPITLSWVLAELAARGLRRILCEGGPTLHRDLIADGLLDELSLTLAPCAVGGVGHRSTAGEALAVRTDFELAHVLLGDDQTLFTGYRRRT